MLMGNCGSGRVGQAVRFGLQLPKPSARDPLEYLVMGVVPALRKVLRAAGTIFTKGPVDEDSDEWVDGTEMMDAEFLFGYRGHLYVVYSDFSVLRPRDGLDAVGSGGREARGALAVLRGKPRARLLAALRTSERLTTRVRRPFVVRAL